MRIALYNGSTFYPLAGQDGVNERVHSSADGFAMAPRAAVQEVALVRADHALPLDRGNLMHAIRFSTSRLFDTPALAGIYCSDYDAAIPRDGTLIIDHVAPNGVVTRRHMANAVIDPPARRAIGCTVFLDYAVRGGAISAGGTKAYGTVTFTGFPAAVQTITIAGRVYTYRTTGPFTELDLEHPAMIGFSESIDAYAADLAEAVNNWVAAPVTASAVAGVVTLTAKVPGTPGNALTLAESASNTTVSGATLSGGVE